MASCFTKMRLAVKVKHTELRGNTMETYKYRAIRAFINAKLLSVCRAISAL